jgi:hypothetical protein
MSYELKQHIYTSSGSKKFETVAISANITARTQASLEAQASRYSRSTTTDDLPLIFRAFYIAAEETFAVSLLAYTGASFDRTEGNYLAHSYVVPAELVKESRYNLAWIAAHLPIAVGYQPRDPYGADRLAPAMVNIEQGQQFNLFAFLIREMGEADLYALFGQLVQSLSESDSKEVMALQMPPPSEGFQNLYTEVHGPDKRISDNQDFLRLLRLAAALAVLPIAFKSQATFAVNELHAASSAYTRDEYAVTVLRASAEKRTAAPPWPWLSHCIALARAEQWAELTTLCEWLNDLLPLHCQGSRAALDAGFELFTVIKQARAENRKLSGGQVAAIVVKFNGAEFEPRSLDQAIREITNEEDRLVVYSAVCNALASTGKVPHHELLAELLRLYGSREGRSAGNQQNILIRLPALTRARIWTEAERQGVFPARFQVRNGNVDLEDLRFAFESFNPNDFAEEPAICDRIVDYLAGILQTRIANYPGLSMPDFPGLRPVLQGMFLLADLERTGIDNQSLHQIFIRRFARAIWGYIESAPEESVRKLISYFVFEVPDNHGHWMPYGMLTHLIRIVVQTVVQIEALANADFTYIMCGVPLKEHDYRQRSMALLQAWLATRMNSFSRSFTEMLVELAEVLNDPRIRLAHENPRRRLPKYSHWVEITSSNRKAAWQNPIAGNPQDIFHYKLKKLFQEIDVSLSIPIAASYLRVNPQEEHSVLLTIRNLIHMKSEPVAEWIQSQQLAHHLSFFAELILVSHSRGPDERDSLIKVLSVVLEHTPKGTGRNWLIGQLANHLRGLDPGLAGKLPRMFPKEW